MPEDPLQQDSMPDCECSERFPIPDSLAEACKECGKVYVDGEPWEYKSGTLMEWAKDLSESKKDKAVEKILQDALSQMTAVLNSAAYRCSKQNAVVDQTDGILNVDTELSKFRIVLTYSVEDKNVGQTQERDS